ncbi:hypothetical protein Tco_1009140 [Tanacetum coccineum]
MPTEMELTLEQTQQGVSYEVSSAILFINDDGTSAESIIKHAHGRRSVTENMMIYDESKILMVLERFNTSAGGNILVKG